VGNIVLAIILIPVLVLIVLDQLARFERTRPWADYQLDRIKRQMARFILVLRRRRLP
jgi:hypothetical protein